MTDFFGLMRRKLLFNQAVGSHQRGDLAEAGQLYELILAAEPLSFEPRHLLGVIRHQQGRNAEALDFIGAALKIDPNSVAALSNYGLVLYALGRFGEALSSYDKALALNPSFLIAWNNRGNALSGLKRFEEALVSFDKALAIKPDHAEALNNRGNALFGLKRFEEALVSLDKSLVIKPDVAEALNNRGDALMGLKRFEEALVSFDKALAIKPDVAEALNNRGNALLGLKRFEEALVSFDKALAIKPDHAETLNNRGNALMGLKCFEKALVNLDKSLAIKPDVAEALNNRGNALIGLKRFEEALVSFDRALAIKSDFAEALYNSGNALSDLKRFEEALVSLGKALAMKPDYAAALNNRSVILAFLGKRDEARAACLEALALDPRLTNAYLNYAGLVKFSADDPHLKTMEAMRDGSAPLSDTDRLQLDFALAKAYADLEDHARSFRRLLSGNRLKRAQIKYDEDNVRALFDRIETTITAQLIREKEQLGGGDPSSMPIFILGMARSGSTLVEQILASHPKVHGAGELTALTNVVSNARGPSGNPVPYPEFVTGLDAHGLSQIAANYLAEIKKLAPTASHITDKMPSNFILAGLIHLSLPKACIIHTVRDPVDTCISCFSKLFAGIQNHTYDLAELGRYYRRYQKLMEHWHRVLPQGRILEVHYEDVVSDLEGQARRIIAHCGIEWDARCLSFHTTNRPVETASSLQVRQPIYQTAVGRARAYEEYLGPLKQALERT